MNEPNPSPNSQPKDRQTNPQTGFFDRIEAEMQAQHRHVQRIQERISALNIEREQVQTGLRRFKHSKTLVRPIRTKLTELRDTLKRTIAEYKGYLGQAEGTGAIETLQPLLVEIQRCYQERADLGRQILEEVRASEAETNLCAEISALLNVWAEQQTPAATEAVVSEEPLEPADSVEETLETDPSDTADSVIENSVPAPPGPTVLESGEVNIEPADFDIEEFFPETLPNRETELPVDLADTLTSSTVETSRTTIVFSDSNEPPDNAKR